MSRAMGAKNYLIEGVSGAGKTTVAQELQRWGYHAINADRDLAMKGDPETGMPLAPPTFRTEEEAIAWRCNHQIWPVDKVQAICADQSHAMTFFCGGSRNFNKILPLMDAVFILEADRDTILERIGRRGADDFGGRPLERAWVIGTLERGDSVPQDGIRIDSTEPVGAVVDAILKLCR